MHHQHQPLYICHTYYFCAVKIDDLNCTFETANVTNSTSSDEETVDDTICGSDNETYASLCDLVQTTTNVYVVHTGACEDPECQGEEVSFLSSLSLSPSSPLPLCSPFSSFPKHSFPHSYPLITFAFPLVKVCGSDGVTYPNSCVLESTSSARVDYPGECVDGNSAEEICIMVLMEGLCVVNSTNCDRLVIPQDGCCPICGEQTG